MLSRLNKLTNIQAVCIIAVIGIAVFSSGLSNPFQGDDYGQIINSIPVHSISHIRLFFEGGTFYAGQGLAPLEGVYFRPLMTTTFSLVYSIFGPHAFYFHLLQLLLGIGSSIILYLFFRYSFKPLLALFLALVFLVHPINSQVLFAIPSTQDALFFFFGILALYLLLRFQSIKSLLFVVISLMLSLLAKETAVLFIFLTVIYLFWWDKRRLLPYIGMLLLPLALYIPLRIHAVGLLTNPYGGPIDTVSLASRLFTAPSIVLFYVTMFLFPWKIASGYYWVYPKFSLNHFLLPLFIDIAIVTFLVYMAYRVYKQAPRALFLTYLFFFSWAAIGLAMLLQIQPLDLTASDIWFYFPMAGILGIFGVMVTVFPIRHHYKWLPLVAIAVVLILGARTILRSFDYRSQYKLSMVDISNSADNYRANKIVAGDLVNQGQYLEAKPYEETALRIFPQYGDFINMAAILINQDDYPGAVHMYKDSLSYAGPGSIHETYDGEGSLTLLTGSQNANRAFLSHAVKLFPHDSLLWMYDALSDERNNDNLDAKTAITNAATYGQVDPVIYANIMEDRAFSITIAGETLHVP